MYKSGTHGPCGLLCECFFRRVKPRFVESQRASTLTTRLWVGLFLFGPLRDDLGMIWSLSPEPVGGDSEKPH